MLKSQIQYLQSFLTSYSVLAIAVAVLMIVGMWKVFTKAGEAGWKCLIPIYNLHVFARICWKASYFWYSVLAAVVCTAIAESVGGSVGVFLTVVAGVVELGYDILSLYHLSKRFGKGTGYTVLLVLFCPIVLMVLGLGSSDYQLSRDN